MGIAQPINSAARVIPAWSLYILLLIPGALLFWQVLTNPGPNPVETLDSYCAYVLQRREETEGPFDFLEHGRPLT